MEYDWLFPFFVSNHILEIFFIIFYFKINSIYISKRLIYYFKFCDIDKIVSNKKSVLLGNHNYFSLLSLLFGSFVHSICSKFIELRIYLIFWKQLYIFILKYIIPIDKKINHLTEKNFLLLNSIQVDSIFLTN